MGWEPVCAWGKRKQWLVLFRFAFSKGAALAALLAAGGLLALACGGEEAIKTPTPTEAVKQASSQASPAGSAAGSGQSVDIQTLQGVKKMPTATPTPSPSPLPAGQTPAPPPPRPTPPPSLSEPVNFFFYVETLTGGSVSKYGLQAVPGCVANTMFKRGMEMVIRFEVVDTKTGKRLLPQDNPKIVVNIPNQEPMTASFSQRGGGRIPDAAFMWNSGAWNIPPNYPLGGLDFTITVTMPDGRTGTFKQPAMVDKNPGGSDTRVQIIP